MYLRDYFVYIVKCSDGSYYTGVTSNLEKRIAEHNSGTIKGYTSDRLPVNLVYPTDLGISATRFGQKNK